MNADSTPSGNRLSMAANRLESTSIVAIYYSVRKPIPVHHATPGRRLSQPTGCSAGARWTKTFCHDFL